MKKIENLIIDSLIKEAEQDNADFEAVLKRLSDEEFYNIVEPKPQKKPWIKIMPWIYSTADCRTILCLPFCFRY